MIKDAMPYTFWITRSLLYYYYYYYYYYLPTFLILKLYVLGRTDHILSFGKLQTAYKTTRPTLLLVLCVYSLPR
jgi:hypothetical protein